MLYLASELIQVGVVEFIQRFLPLVSFFISFSFTLIVKTVVNLPLLPSLSNPISPLKTTLTKHFLGSSTLKPHLISPKPLFYSSRTPQNSPNTIHNKNPSKAFNHKNHVFWVAGWQGHTVPLRHDRATYQNLGTATLWP